MDQEQEKLYNDDDYLSPSEAADLIKVARTTVNYWIRKYGLKAKTSPGGRYKILYSDFKTFLEFHGKNQSIRLKRQKAKYKIAIIDSSKNTAQNYESWLSELYTIKIVNNVSNPIREMLRFSPDVIILEVLLDGGLDGFKILESARKELMLKNSIIFVISKRFNEDDIVRALEAGARDYIKKPVGANELRSRVKNLLRNIIDIEN